VFRPFCGFGYIESQATGLWLGGCALSMKMLPEDTIHFLKKQGYVIVSTIDDDGTIHNACKGILKIIPEGQIYILDLYMGRTYRNLKKNPVISLTSADEHSFSGYSLKGRAEIVPKENLEPALLRAWDEAIVSRVTSRLLKNIRGEKGHHLHPEALLPNPKYMIRIDVEEVIDLTPKHLK